MPNDLALLTATRQARQIRMGKASSQEVVRAALPRVRALDPRLTTFITITEEEALRQARQADDALRQGKALGPLRGVPVALKDNFETRGVRTTAGSRVVGVKPTYGRVPDPPPT